MIENEGKYKEWIISAGVGKKDKVASSIASYISYLNSVSNEIGQTISKRNLYNEECITVISAKLAGKKSEKSISNYKSAMRQYVQMVKFHQNSL
jgi:hypothetical protein